MFLFGSRDTICRSKRQKKSLFQNAIKLLERENRIGPYLPLYCPRHQKSTRIETEKDFEKVVDGGCDERCGGTLDCGHMCELYCHPLENGHPMKCMKPCTRILEDCSHHCVKLCHEECGGCEEKVNITLTCGHTATVPCWRRKADDIRCTKPVRLSDEYKPCQHYPDDVPCSDEQLLRELFEDRGGSVRFVHKKLIRNCQEKCGEYLEDCGHHCETSCGECSRIMAEEVWLKETSNLRQPPQPLSLRRQIGHNRANIACVVPCDRILLCGHLCEEKCCKQGECPPCKQSCSRTCTHSSCQKDCHEVCPPCAEPCTWSCDCQGQPVVCPLPCGSPCFHVPCSNRCQKTLQCGHQCPSLCGEVCPPKSVCRECMKQTKSKEEIEKRFPHATSVVDFITFSNLFDHDPNDSPLLILKCGHIFTTESLDGAVKLKTVYHMPANLSTDEKALVKAKPLLGMDPHEIVASFRCPTCRCLISGINRYRRIQNYVQLIRCSQKWMIQGEIMYREVTKKMEELRKKREMNEKWLNMKEAADVVIAHKRYVVKRRKELRDAHPTRRIREMEESYLKRNGNDETDVNNLSLNLKPECQLLDAVVQACLFVASVAPRLERYKAKKKEKQGGMKKEKKYGKRTEEEKENNISDLSLSLSLSLSLDDDQLQLKHVVRDTPELFQDRCSLFIENCIEAATTINEFDRMCTEGALLSLVRKVPFLRAELYCVIGEGVNELSKGRTTHLFLSLSLLPTLFQAFPELDGASAYEVPKRCSSLALSLIKDISESKQENANKREALSLRIKALEGGEPLTTEEKKMIFKVMSEDVGTGTGGFGGHWYQCPNGHVYTIGECGGAMEESHCIECGEKVGGERHRLTETNTTATPFLTEIEATEQMPSRDFRQLAELNLHIPDDIEEREREGI